MGCSSSSAYSVEPTSTSPSFPSPPPSFPGVGVSAVDACSAHEWVDTASHKHILNSPQHTATHKAAASLAVEAPSKGKGAPLITSSSQPREERDASLLEDSYGSLRDHSLIKPVSHNHQAQQHSLLSSLSRSASPRQHQDGSSTVENTSRQNGPTSVYPDKIPPAIPASNSLSTTHSASSSRDTHTRTPNHHYDKDKTHSQSQSKTHIKVSSNSRTTSTSSTSYKHSSLVQTSIASPSLPSVTSTSTSSNTKSQQHSKHPSHVSHSVMASMTTLNISQDVIDENGNGTLPDAQTKSSSTNTEMPQPSASPLSPYTQSQQQIQLLFSPSSKQNTQEKQQQQQQQAAETPRAAPATVLSSISPSSPPVNPSSALSPSPFDPKDDKDDLSMYSGSLFKDMTPPSSVHADNSSTPLPSTRMNEDTQTSLSHSQSHSLPSHIHHHSHHNKYAIHSSTHHQLASSLSSSPYLTTQSRLSAQKKSTHSSHSISTSASNSRHTITSSPLPPINYGMDQTSQESEKASQQRAPGHHYDSSTSSSHNSQQPSPSITLPELSSHRSFLNQITFNSLPTVAMAHDNSIVPTSVDFALFDIFPEYPFQTLYSSTVPFFSINRKVTTFQSSLPNTATNSSGSPPNPSPFVSTQPSASVDSNIPTLTEPSTSASASPPPDMTQPSSADAPMLSFTVTTDDNTSLQVLTPAVTVTQEKEVKPPPTDFFLPYLDVNFTNKVQLNQLLESFPSRRLMLEVSSGIWNHYFGTYLDAIATSYALSSHSLQMSNSLSSSPRVTPRSQLPGLHGPSHNPSFANSHATNYIKRTRSRSSSITSLKPIGLTNHHYTHLNPNASSFFSPSIDQLEQRCMYHFVLDVLRFDLRVLRERYSSVASSYSAHEMSMEHNAILATIKSELCRLSNLPLEHIAKKILSEVKSLVAKDLEKERESHVEQQPHVSPLDHDLTQYNVFPSANQPTLSHCHIHTADSHATPAHPLSPELSHKDSPSHSFSSSSTGSQSSISSSVHHATPHIHSSINSSALHLTFNMFHSYIDHAMRNVFDKYHRKGYWLLFSINLMVHYCQRHSIPIQSHSDRNMNFSKSSPLSTPTSRQSISVSPTVGLVTPKNRLLLTPTSNAEIVPSPSSSIHSTKPSRFTFAGALPSNTSSVTTVVTNVTTVPHNHRSHSEIKYSHFSSNSDGTNRAPLNLLQYVPLPTMNLPTSQVHTCTNNDAHTQPATADVPASSHVTSISQPSSHSNSYKKKKKLKERSRPNSLSQLEGLTISKSLGFTPLDTIPSAHSYSFHGSEETFNANA